MGELTHDPASHYDRVTDAWGLLLGEDLHYGVFQHGDEDLPTATAALTNLMADAAQVESGGRVLDVGCGTGAPACWLAESFQVDVTGITTSPVGVAAANQRAASHGLQGQARFEQRDGMANGFADSSFDTVWVLESSHLMRQRRQLIAECARVLRPGGRLVLCDIVLRRPMPFDEVKRLRTELTILRDVFGDAHMDLLDSYSQWASEEGLTLDRSLDLTAATRPTFSRWRDNADRHHQQVVDQLGSDGWQRFVEACEVLEALWDDGTLGYGLLAAERALEVA